MDGFMVAAPDAGDAEAFSGLGKFIAFLAPAAPVDSNKKASAATKPRWQPSQSPD
jgi:hypothetical protein